MSSFFISIPHAGEMVPKGAQWLHNLPEPVLMRDADRYVDVLYARVIEELKIPAIIADCHRYVIDLNRYPHEFDAQAVEGAVLPKGTHPKGLHWSVTTQGEILIPAPMSMSLHDELVFNFYTPFHEKIKELSRKLKVQGDVYHLDLHSMPSKGTAMHNDPGGTRADIVVSDFHGKSCQKDFVTLVQKSYEDAGFSVSYNWPYFGGGITQMYGKPQESHHTVQVELNRALYMDEETKKKAPIFLETQSKLTRAIQLINAGLV